ncbi:MAG: AAA family ATPase, partial [Thaumarchaeota archaeon]|nr:AAA family ATPase [Nitrososphaerota archaeon]
MDEIVLKIAEVPQRYVGNGIAIVDPKLVDDNQWTGGQVLEIVGNKKSHVRLWPGSPEDYGTGVVRIDGLTRYNIGSGIGEKISVKQVDVKEAQRIVLSPVEKISEEGLQEYMQENYDGHVLT